MASLRWYKRNAQDALTGMMMLSLEERGAYNTLLDLIYAHENRLWDDDRVISGWMRCDIRVWKRIKTRLVDLGKIVIVDGRITNLRATSEIDEGLGRAASVSDVNRAKGIKSGLARNKNKDLNEPGANRARTEPETEPEEESKGSLAPTPKTTRGTRLSRDFKPDETCERIARERGFSTKDWQACMDNFFDYWTGVAGAKGTKLDWQATFRNRVRDFKLKSKGDDYGRRSDRKGLTELAFETLSGGDFEGDTPLWLNDHRK